MQQAIQLTNSEKSVDNRKNQSLLVFECRFVSVDESKLSELYDLVDASSFHVSDARIESVASVLDTDVVADGESDPEKKNFSVLRTIQNPPTSWGTISSDQVRAILELIKGQNRSNITQAPTVTMFEGQSGRVIDGSLRPFVVGVDVVEGEAGAKAHRPVIQPIEEGTFLHVSGHKIDGRIQINAGIVMNQIVSVDQVKIHTGKAAGATVQVPKCRMHAVKLQASLISGQTVLLDTGLIKQTSEPIEKRGLQRLPYIRTMTGPVFQSVRLRTLIMLTVREIEPEATPDDAKK